MAIQYFVGFEAGEPNVNDLSLPPVHEINNFNTISGGTVAIVRNQDPRTGHYFLRINATSTTNSGMRAHASRITAIASNFVTFWFRVPSYPSGSTELFRHGQFGVRLMISSSGVIQAQRHTAAGSYSDEGTPTDPIDVDVWHRIDVSDINQDSATNYFGSFKFNGEELASFGPVTRHSSFLSLGDATLGAPTASTGTTFTFDYDDLILDSAAFPTSSPGVVRMLPNATGNYTDWTGGFELVDEYAPVLTTTDSITTSAVSNKTSFGLKSAADSFVGGDILAVQAFALGRRTAGTSGNISAFLRSGGTDTTSTAISMDTTDFGYCYSEPFELDPADSTAWSNSKLDSLEVVVESLTGTSVKYVSTMGAMVLCTAPGGDGDLILVPSITSISPDNGPKAGSTAVTITGSNFTGATAARIGGVALTSFTVVSDTSITGTTGAISKAGTYNVEVVGAEAVGVLTNAFTYTPGNSSGQSGNNAGGGTSLVVSVPSNNNGDVMWCFVTVRGTTTTVTQSTWGAAVDVRSNGSNASHHTFRKVSNGSEPASYTFTLGSSQKASGVMIAVPDVDNSASSYQVSSQANASSTSVTSPSLTPRRGGSVSVVGSGTAVGTTFTPPTDYTEPANADNASTGGSAASRTTTEGAFRNLVSQSATGALVATAGSAAVNAGTHVMQDGPGVIELPLIDNGPVIYNLELQGTDPATRVPFRSPYSQVLSH